MPAGKASMFQAAVDSYLNNVQEVIDELNNFGDTAMQVVTGGVTDGSNVPIIRRIPLLGRHFRAGSEADWSFLINIETSLRRFIIGSAGISGGGGTTGSSTGVMQYMCTLGIAISLIFFLISILQLVTEDRFTPEFLVKFFAKFVIAFAVIIWSPYILSGMIDFGSAFAVDVAGFASSVMEDGNGFDASELEAIVKNQAIYYYKNVGWDNWTTTITPRSGAKDMWLWGLGHALPYYIEGAMLGMFKLISYLLNAVVMFIVVTRLLELYVRGAFLPIAAALMSDDGWKGSGGRYFRKLLSLATQNAAIIMVASTFGVMMRSAMGSIFTSTILKKYGITHCSTLRAVSECTTCLASISRIQSPINIPVLKPMAICITLCVAGLGLMFKTTGLMDDIWGAR